MEYYSALKKNEIMTFAATWMDPEILILSEESQTNKYKYDINYMWSLRNDSKEWRVFISIFLVLLPLSSFCLLSLLKHQSLRKLVTNLYVMVSPIIF